MTIATSIENTLLLLQAMPQPQTRLLLCGCLAILHCFQKMRDAGSLELGGRQQQASWQRSPMHAAPSDASGHRCAPVGVGGRSMALPNTSNICERTPLPTVASPGSLTSLVRRRRRFGVTAPVFRDAPVFGDVTVVDRLRAGFSHSLSTTLRWLCIQFDNVDATAGEAVVNAGVMSIQWFNLSARAKGSRGVSV